MSKRKTALIVFTVGALIGYGSTWLIVGPVAAETPRGQAVGSLERDRTTDTMDVFWFGDIDTCGTDCDGTWSPGEDYPPGFPENKRHPMYPWPPVIKPWPTVEDMKDSWKGIPDPRSAALYWDMTDMNYSVADMQWDAWWTYWDECYHDIECSTQWPIPPVPTTPEPPEYIAPCEASPGPCNEDSP